MADPTSKQHSRQIAPSQIWNENTKTGAMSHERFGRGDHVSAVTSGKAGKLIPLYCSPLLREDGVSPSTLTVSTQMNETASMLLNAVRVSVTAHLVPKLAFKRFKDMGSIDRSFNGQPEVDNNVIPWFENESDTAKQFYKTLGLHASAGGENYNTDYLEAYNAVWNHMALERSPALTPRDLTDGSLAPAFWEHTQMKYVKPSFDDAMLEGTVPLTVVESQMPVHGINRIGSGSVAGNPATVHSDATNVNFQDAGGNGVGFQIRSDAVSSIYAELQQNGVTVSLANLDLARQTTAWARARVQYQGLSEEWMMDQLLAGIRLKDEHLRQPILLDHKQGVIGMTQRYATDSGNLEKSLTDGRNAVTLSIRAPAIETGAVIVVCAQALPEQIYERQRDYYFAATKVSDLPNRISDELDPQPVSLVSNFEVDEAHATGTALFGYAPLNHQWQRTAPRIGGKYHRPDPTAEWTENRNRIWEGGVVNPALGPDFYLSTTLTDKVFAAADVDNFEFWTQGDIRINGLTYFGPALRESTDQYSKVLSKVDLNRHKGDGTDTPAVPSNTSDDVTE